MPDRCCRPECAPPPRNRSPNDPADGPRLAAAAQRGVKIRFIYEEGGSDSRAETPEKTTSMRLESAGADVRFVNQVMHHKVMIVDGPRDDLSKAKSLALGSEGTPIAKAISVAAGIAQPCSATGSPALKST